MVAKTITLQAASNSPAGKFYTVDIVEAFDGCTVDYRHGAVGGSVKTGTKTKVPVSREKAETIFAALVKEKMTGDSHYLPVETASTAFVAPIASADGPAWIAPRLLNDVDPDRVFALCADYDWWAQIKHDGDRVQLHCSLDGQIVMLSGRSGKNRACPAPIVAAIAAFDETLALDGELVGDVFWVFDVLNFDGHDFTSEPYWSRYESLEMILDGLTRTIPTGDKFIRIVTTATIQSDKARLILEAKESSAEGVVFIRKDKPYEAGRPASGGNNLRWKFRASASVVVAAHNDKCSMAIALGDGTPIGTVSMLGKGTLPPVGAVIEVEYLYAQGSLVQAQYKGLRTDVVAADCTRAKLQFKGGIDPLA